MDPRTKKAMSKDEVGLLLDLIQRNPMITSKETNAAANRVKEECWASLTDIFNSKSGQTPRRQEQLKLKWDNLKKAARKRAANIQMSNFKSGHSDCITNDDILDKVIGLLGPTCSALDVPFGGDGHTSDGHGSDIMEIGLYSVCDVEYSPEDEKVNSPDDPLLPINTMKKRKLVLSPQAGSMSGESFNKGGKCIYGMTPRSKPLQSKGKKFKSTQDDGRLQRNLAIAKYYEKKSEKLDLEIEILKIELANKNCNINKQ